jgi:hypothetical protein
MKKTILIFAAIFIANNIFSQKIISNLNDTLNASIDQFNTYLIENNEKPLNIDNVIFNRIATDEMKRFTDSSFQKLKCVALSRKWGVTIPLACYIGVFNEHHPDVLDKSSIQQEIFNKMLFLYKNDNDIWTSGLKVGISILQISDYQIKVNLIFGKNVPISSCAVDN